MGCSTSRPEVKEKKDRGFHDIYILGKKIASHSFGHSYEAIYTEVGRTRNYFDDRQRAVKIFDLRLSSPKLLKMVQNEVSLWKQVGYHDNCVRLIDVFFQQHLTYMVFEKCCGILVTHIELMEEVNERSLGLLFHQMLLALQHLHENRVVHRDVKPVNFMIGGDDESTIKLGDFGLAQILPEDRGLHGECGLVGFMCPEMVMHEEYCEKADIWSFAVLVYTLLFGRYPYMPGRGTDIKAAIKGDDPPISFSSLSDRSCAAIAFIMTLLNRLPNERASAKDALRMTYMTSLFDAPDENEVFPPLTQEFELAKGLRAFEVGDIAEDLQGGVDELLNTLQLHYRGMSLEDNGVKEAFAVTKSQKLDKSTTASQSFALSKPRPSTHTTTVTNITAGTTTRKRTLNQREQRELQRSISRSNTVKSVGRQGSRAASPRGSPRSNPGKALLDDNFSSLDSQRKAGSSSEDFVNSSCEV